MIDARLLRDVTGIPAPDGCTFDTLGLVTAHRPNSLTFLDQAKFAAQLRDNPNVTGVLVTPALADSIESPGRPLEVLLCDDPRWAYFTLHNHIARAQYVRSPSRIDPTAAVHPSAVISDYNVEIGAGTVIGSHVTILPDVRIGANCVVQPGTVIGSEGFEVKRTSRGIVSVFHDGIVDIRDGAEIGANTCIDKGFVDFPTLIEEGARVDNLVHVAHRVRIRRGAFVIAGTVLGGTCEIGPGVWVSINSSVAPGLVVGENAFLSIGAVVTKNVAAGEQVTGNFAIPHKTFLNILKEDLKRFPGQVGGDG